MAWVWEHKNWPTFEYDATAFLEYEKQFYTNAGVIKGVFSHLAANNLEHLKIDILTQEALSTSSIEGEILQRASVQSSIRKHLGLKTDAIKIPANAAGIAEMMTDVYLHFDKPLTNETFFTWHSMLMNGRRDIETIGDYRKHDEAMQIVSGNLSAPKVFYEAPPSKYVGVEMEKLITWCNEQMDNTNGISIIALAGIAHLYFEIIHPFEDGNGRLGRALIEKLISQKMKTPALNSFAKVIEQNKRAYYDALQSCNHSLDINEWLQFFSKMLLESQQYTIRMVNFIVAKTKFFAKYKTEFNARQEKVLLRVFEEGLEGFKGGLSAANYKTISTASPATSTRDLQELLNIKALSKTGNLKGTRYFLNLEGL
jgi:Fic family protein